MVHKLQRRLSTGNILKASKTGLNPSWWTVFSDFRLDFLAAPYMEQYIVYFLTD